MPLNGLFPDTHGTRRIPRKWDGRRVSLIVPDIQIASISDHSIGSAAVSMVLGLVILSALKRYWPSGALLYHVLSRGRRAGETAAKAAEESHIAVSELK